MQRSSKLKIVIWGVGKFAQKLLEFVPSREFCIAIVAVVDTSEEKQGKMWNGYLIQSPQNLRHLDYDKIITPPGLIYFEICNQYKREFGEDIDISKIDTCYFLHRENFLQHYANEWKDKEKKICIEYVKQNPLQVFNYDFVKEYINISVEIKFDDISKLFYTFYKSKKLYFSRSFNTVEKAESYIKFLLMEQNSQSPHKYCDSNFNVLQGQVVLDAGVAEGNFALDVIDKVKRIYLVEADELWIEALNYTFAPYSDRVTIIHGYLSDRNIDGCITIDEIIKESPLDFIKMDIEGAEISALIGGKHTLLNNDVRMAVCAYHGVHDYDNIVEYLENIGYECTCTSGYMVYLNIENFTRFFNSRLVRGIVRSRKKVGMVNK